MDIESIKWNKKTYNEFIKYLISLSDENYKKFHSNIVNTKLDIIGIRVPVMRNIAKKLLKTNIEDYFKLVQNNYYEEIFIYGIVLANSSEELIGKYLIDFISRIDNWAICDSFSSSLKIINKKQRKYWIYFTNLIDLDKEYQTRVSIVIMMNYYLSDQYIDRVLKIVTSINSEYYYINMAISWLLSVAIIDYKEKVLELLKSKKLSKFIQNKTISKIQDSYRISKNIKDEVKKYRI